MRALFPVVEEASLRDYGHVRYAGGGDDCDIGVSALARDPERVEGLTVFRPIAEPRLWDALAAVLKMGNGVLYAPGAARPLVAHGSVDGHLPPDLTRALGYPQAVNSGAEIREARDPRKARPSPAGTRPTPPGLRCQSPSMRLGKEARKGREKGKTSILS